MLLVLVSGLLLHTAAGSPVAPEPLEVCRRMQAHYAKAKLLVFEVDEVIRVPHFREALATKTGTLRVVRRGLLRLDDETPEETSVFVDASEAIVLDRVTRV